MWTTNFCHGLQTMTLNAVGCLQSIDTLYPTHGVLVFSSACQCFQQKSSSKPPRSDTRAVESIHIFSAIQMRYTPKCLSDHASQNAKIISAKLLF
ncbi:hypothetical protein CPSG_09376 [Coccidioides posadasii str. Silveira]|uniref:Uncharacterized protein n=1 Tax=Coccidioides posadasii (strain RMSCC 757 / Silveira) TaxID=443226 RepID=E9DHS7_COCPS|nr:hypothetical protein CPSG_09376 [Coccidioides posadasii str. Silveira]